MVASLALALPPTAQGSGGSEENVAISQSTTGLGGYSVGGTGQATSAGLGQVATGPTATSENYTLHGGVAWTVPEITGDNPILFGAAEASGSKDGGQTVEVFGYNFQAAGAGTLDVFFGAQPGTGTTVLSNTRATTIAPGEVDAFGNPPPEVVLSVTNALGSDDAKTSQLAPSYLYKPSLFQTDHARVGRRMQLHVHTEMGDTLILVLGQVIPGTAIPFPPMEGAIEVLINQQFAVPLQFLPGDQYRHLIDVPNDPSLFGSSLSYQAASLSNLALLEGAFSNSVTITVQP